MTIAIACQQKSKQSALIFCLLFLCLSSIYEKTYASPVQLSGWHSTWLTGGTSVPTKHALAYKPSSLREGKTFKIIIWAPEITNTENLDSWLVSRASTIQKSLGQPKKKWRVKSEKSGARSLNNSFKNSSGVNFQVGYQADWTDNGEAYVGQLIASNHLAMMLKYGVKIETVIAHALSVFDSDDYKNRLVLAQTAENDESNSSNVQVETTPDASSQSSAAINIKPGAVPKGLKEIRGVQVYGMQPGGVFGLTEEFIATFDDGTYTTDFSLTFNEGVRESKSREPESWGRWRERSGKLELTEKGSQVFDTTIGNWIVDRGSAGENLTKCFSRRSSAGGAGPLVGGSRTWCFTPDGRFANSSAVYATSNTAGVVSASGSPRVRGHYFIDGYTIRLAFDSGQQETAAFAFASGKKHHIVINGLRYIGKEP